MQTCEIVNTRGEVVGQFKQGDEERHAAAWLGSGDVKLCSTTQLKPGETNRGALLRVAKRALAGDRAAGAMLDDGMANKAAAELWDHDPGVRAEFVDVADLAFALRHPTPQAMCDAVTLGSDASFADLLD